MTIIAAADGSALGNPGPAGWAWYIDQSRWRCGGWSRGTNNQGELTAVLDLLRQTAHTDEPLHVLCDSRYVINSVTTWMAGWKRKGWKKADGKPVLNVEVMKALDEAMKGRRVTFEWVKGHAGHELNEKADGLANGAAQAHASKSTPLAGPGFPGALAVGAGDDPAAPPAADRSPPTRAPRSSSPEPDLFSLDASSDEESTTSAGRAAVDHVVDLERSLLTDAVRSDRTRLDSLLHPDFSEIGASGHLRTRDEVLDRTTPLDGTHRLEVLGTDSPAEGQILLLWRSTGGESSPPALRSSLWVREGAAWRIRFHQGTPQA